MKFILTLAIAVSALISLACGQGGGLVLFVDAEHDPMAGTFTSTSQPLHEANRGVAQTFTVLRAGKLEEFRIMVTDGESVDDGIIRLTVRPLNGMGEPDEDPMTSIIPPFDIDTSTLPATLVSQFTIFFLGNDPGREVVVGETYAIVVDFVSRTTSTDVDPIARVLGSTDAMGDLYTDGTGATGESTVAFTNNTDDYFFRTFVLN